MGQDDLFIHTSNINLFKLTSSIKKHLIITIYEKSYNNIQAHNEINIISLLLRINSFFHNMYRKWDAQTSLHQSLSETGFSSLFWLFKLFSQLTKKIPSKDKFFFLSKSKVYFRSFFLTINLQFSKKSLNDRLCLIKVLKKLRNSK